MKVNLIQKNNIDRLSNSLEKLYELRRESVLFKNNVFIYRGTYDMMNSIDESVGKVFKEEKLPDKEVVRRVLKLWN